MSQTIDRPTTEDNQPRPPRPLSVGAATPARRRPITVETGHKPSLLGDVGDDFDLDKPVSRKRSFVLSPFLRARISLFLITIVAVVIIVQLFTLQVQDRYNTKNYAAQYQTYKDDIMPQRGLIMDDNGLVMASNIWVYNIYAAPQGLTQSQSGKIASQLAGFLPTVSADTIKQAVTYTDAKHIYNLIASAVDSDTAQKIQAAKLTNIYLEPQPRRTYPNNTMLSDLLGFANNENQGAYGVEGYYNNQLHGTAGTRLAERDGDGNPIILGQIQLTPAVDGGDVSLTIDSGIQLMVEQELQKGMVEHQAEKGMAIVADPQTGAILAWASFPNYNPNDFYKTDPALLTDPMVTDVYEPGSTFKILTAAIGIDTHTITPDSNAGTLPGCVIKYGQRICNYNSVGYDNQTPIVTLIHSSNVGAMWIAEHYGPDKYYDYLKKFGIGAQTGVDLSGEGQGILRTPDQKSWSPLDFLTNSFGQGVAVTPIQLVAAVSAVANGGKLMKPYVVSKITDGDKVIQENKPTVVRQVISPESAKITTGMLVDAVQQGETRLAGVKGYKIAGKTGTTSLYNSDLTIGSTIAYAPADNPRFIVLVRYDKTKDTPWGSNTAAPVVADILQQLFIRYNIPPTEPIK